MKVNFFILVLATFHGSFFGSFLGSMVANFICYLQHLHKKYFPLLYYYDSLRRVPRCCCGVLCVCLSSFRSFRSRSTRMRRTLVCRKNMLNKCQFLFLLLLLFIQRSRVLFLLSDTLWILCFSTVIAIQYYHIILILLCGSSSLTGSLCGCRTNDGKKINFPYFLVSNHCHRFHFLSPLFFFFSLLRKKERRFSVGFSFPIFFSKLGVCSLLGGP